MECSMCGFECDGSLRQNSLPLCVRCFGKVREAGEKNKRPYICVRCGRVVTAVNSKDLCADCSDEKPLSDLLASGASPTRQQIEDDGYAILRDVFANAVGQASGGKGKERHANGSPFVDQPILAITRLLTGHPCGALAYQAIKKTIEAGRLVELKGTDAAVAELRGAMNYIAAMVIYLEEQASKGKP